MHVVKFETTTKFIIGGRCIPHHWGIFFSFFSFFFAHFHFPASGQAEVTGVVPSPPRFLPSIFIAHRVQQSHCSSIFHRVLLTHALALSASQFVHKKKSKRIYTSMHSAGLELTKLAYTRLEDNLIRDRGDRLVFSSVSRRALRGESPGDPCCEVGEFQETNSKTQQFFLFAVEFLIKTGQVACGVLSHQL